MLAACVGLLAEFVPQATCPVVWILYTFLAVRLGLSYYSFSPGPAARGWLSDKNLEVNFLT